MISRWVLEKRIRTRQTGEMFFLMFEFELV